MTTMDTRQVAEVPTQFNWMDRMFDEWIKAFPAARNLGLHWPFQVDDVIRVDEFQDAKTQVIRAELPGIDPDKDLEITVANGLLHINAERTVEHETTGQGFTRHELRCGSLTRTLPLPGGATESDITATYQDGILEIRIPVVAPAATREPTTIAVGKS